MADAAEIVANDGDLAGPPAKKTKLEETPEQIPKEKGDEKKGTAEDTNAGPPVKGSEKQFRGAVRETDVGITEYISDYKGFGGIIKQRWVRDHDYFSTVKRY